MNLYLGFEIKVTNLYLLIRKRIKKMQNVQISKSNFKRIYFDPTLSKKETILNKKMGKNRRVIKRMGIFNSNGHL